ncbi:MAG: hypothetical protein OXF74_06330 [Rhodobacteraceae bacterium]|nr:hypothetical protein [Paracoccaceae bacterium]
MDDRLYGVGWSGVTERDRQLNLDYDLSRQSPEIWKSPYPLAARDPELDNSRGGITGSVEWRAGSYPGTRRDLPSGMVTDESVGHLVHQGASREDD